MIEYTAQAVIVGGGATGVGILRDLSMRGISVILFELGDLAHGTSSRFHGLLHSGARYAVKDPASAAECAQENAILKKIAPNCIDDCGGWFVQTEDDDSVYTEKWLIKCQEAGISVREIPVAEAYAKEPLLKRKAVRIFEVPDAAVDGFKLVWANAKSAKRYGGEYKTYHQVERLLRDGDRIIGVSGRISGTGEGFVAHSNIVINAAGAWAPHLVGTVGISLEILCDKGALLAFNQRLFQRVINHLRQPGDGDIFVPHETITILGTTSEFVDSPEENRPTVDEVYKLLSQGEELLPEIQYHRVIRAFAGVRPLYQEEEDDRSEEKRASLANINKAVIENDVYVKAGDEVKVGDEGREVSRNFAIIDHKFEQGVEGLLSIAGGKFTTYRLMAEKASDWVACQLGNQTPCRTAIESLQPEISPDLYQQALKLLPWGAADKMLERLGSEAAIVLGEIQADPRKGQMLCECELVSVAEVQHAVIDKDAHCLSDVRRKTRLGMGTCQGAFCSYRAFPLLGQNREKYAPLREELRNFLNQRWKGIRPVLWGQQLRETELTRAIYSDLLRF